MNGNDIIVLGLGLQLPWETTGQQLLAFYLSNLFLV